MSNDEYGSCRVGTGQATDCDDDVDEYGSLRVGTGQATDSPFDGKLVIKRIISLIIDMGNSCGSPSVTDIPVYVDFRNKGIPCVSSDPAIIFNNLTPLIDYIDACVNKKQTTQTRDQVKAFIDIAYQVMDNISKHAEKFSDIVDNFASKPLGLTTRLLLSTPSRYKNFHLLSLGFALIAYVSEQIDEISSNQTKCIKLLVSMKDFAQHAATHNRSLPTYYWEEADVLKKCALIIVVGAIVCFCQMEQRTIFRSVS
eukprot:Gb_28784 [translate_table: standard]